MNSLSELARRIDLRDSQKILSRVFPQNSKWSLHADIEDFRDDEITSHLILRMQGKEVLRVSVYRDTRREEDVNVQTAVSDPETREELVRFVQKAFDKAIALDDEIELHRQKNIQDIVATLPVSAAIDFGSAYTLINDLLQGIKDNQRDFLSIGSVGDVRFSARTLGDFGEIKIVEFHTKSTSLPAGEKDISLGILTFEDSDHHGFLDSEFISKSNAMALIEALHADVQARADAATKVQNDKLNQEIREALREDFTF